MNRIPMLILALGLLASCAKKPVGPAFTGQKIAAILPVDMVAPPAGIEAVVAIATCHGFIGRGATQEQGQDCAGRQTRSGGAGVETRCAPCATRWAGTRGLARRGIIGRTVRKRPGQA